jgi:hypothetical protein
VGLDTRLRRYSTSMQAAPVARPPIIAYRRVGMLCMLIE